MRLNLPVSGREVMVGETANILSTTDLKGTITYANPDFVAISGFDEAELLGAPHNLVRHPDMPVEAFADLWQTLQTSRSWMGIVKNRCRTATTTGSAPSLHRSAATARWWNTSPCEPAPNPSRSVLPRRCMPRCAMAVARGHCVAPWACASEWRCWPPVPVRSVWPSVACWVRLRHCHSGRAGDGAAAAALAAFTLAPLSRLARQARRVGHNPVSQLIYTGRKDEIGEIAFAMKMLETEAGAMVGRIADCSRQLSEHARNLLGAMQGSTESASRQQRETDLIATAIQQMTASVQDVALNAQRTAEVAARADSEAASGRQIVGRTGDSITRLAGDIQQAAEVIHQLESHSQEISRVLEVIHGIAEQTNLLALNAAIEAARARRSGPRLRRGCRRVRQLASRTSWRPPTSSA